MAKSKITKKQANHIVARVSGVTENDTKLEAARKAIETMKMVGMPASAIAKAERMYEAAKARGVI